MKLYAGNTALAGQLLESAFAILRNEGLQPVDCMALAYSQLAGGIDVSPAQQVAMHDCLRRVVATHDGEQRPESTEDPNRIHPID
jgi:hypothetical protein